MIQFVAKCLNMIMYLSFMISVTGSGLVAKCSNILQDIKVFDKNLETSQLYKNSLDIFKILQHFSFIFN